MARSSVSEPAARIWLPPERGLEQDELTRGSVFLAGTIDNGSAVDWQVEATRALRPVARHIFNPRRLAWDSSWVQSEDNPLFNEQVSWELDHIDAAEVVLFYFAPGSLSPITLLELGLTATRVPDKLVVCCPDGFWRKGNVDIVCTRHKVQRVSSFDAMIACAKARLSQPGKEDVALYRAPTSAEPPCLSYAPS